jgi:hypothetical protein
MMNSSDNLSNWKGSVSEAETSDDGEPRLQIVDNSLEERHVVRPTFQKSISLNEDVNATDAVESLLMLGRADSWTKTTNSPIVEGDHLKGRRFSAGDMSFTQDEKGVVTYYQVKTNHIFYFGKSRDTLDFVYLGF